MLCCIQEKWLCLLSFVICYLYFNDVPYPSSAFGRLYPALSGQMPSYHVVRRQGIFYSGHLGSSMWVVTGRIGGDGDSRSQQSPESLLVILVSWWQVLTSIVVGLSLQTVDWCRLGALLGLKSPQSLSFPMGIVGPSLKGFMLAIDIASTYGTMDSLMYTGLMTSGEICNKVC